MANKEIVNFLKDGLKKGLPLSELKQNLLARGFADYDINEAIKGLNSLEVEIKKPVKSLSFFSPRFILYSILFVLAILIVVVIFMFESPSETIFLEGNLTEGVSVDIMQNKLQLEIDNKTESLEFEKITEDSVKVFYNGNETLFLLGDNKQVDLNGDGIFDIKMRLDSTSNENPTFYIEEIGQEIKDRLREIQKIRKAAELNDSICKQNWTCSEWTECNSSGQQSQTCVDVNHCRAVERIPVNVRKCKIEENLVINNETLLQEILTQVCLDEGAVLIDDCNCTGEFFAVGFIPCCKGECVKEF